MAGIMCPSKAVMAALWQADYNNIAITTTITTTRLQQRQQQTIWISTKAIRALVKKTTVICPSTIHINTNTNTIVNPNPVPVRTQISKTIQSNTTPKSQLQHV